MEDENQLPLKRVELSLSKFNDVAIPHHLELLRQHKANIIKHEEAGQYVQVRGEQAGAARAAARLRALLAELAALRARVCEPDRAAFDARTQRSRDLTLQAIMDYLESSPMSIGRSHSHGAAVAGSAVSTDSVGVVAHARARAGAGEAAGAGAGAGADADDDCDVPMLQLQIDDRELALAEREAALRGWTELQAELRALHGAWAATHAAARAQRDQLQAAAGHVDVAADNVQAAKAHLSSAEKLRAGAWGAGGAALGALLGGPLGLVVGAKAGAAALLAGSALGYVGARLLGHKRQEQLALQVPVAGCAALGALLGGPLGLVVGAKAGAAALLAGSALGYVCARLLGHKRQEQLALQVPVAGCAALGALLGGPLGLVVGAKAGAAALLAGSALGYVGARLLGHKRQEQLALQVPVAGCAALGALLGGPLGLVVGAKAGAAALLAGSALGYVGARLLGHKRQEQLALQVPVAGCAALGALLGGPLGLVVGAKAGAAALLAGSALGYVGARLLGHKRQEQLALQVPVAGCAALGALLGGPLGLVVGAKAGAAALLAGSALGYVGARLLGHKRQEQLALQVPVAGCAALGALLGGPLGLVVGAKAGAAALLAGSALGYVGARLLGHKRQEQLALQVPVAGCAALGALLGGPLGLVVGAKAGAAALLAGSALGYVGARLLGHKRQEQLALQVPVAGCAALGALLGGPLGLVVGAKAGAAALLAGSALGYVGARLLGHKRQEQLALQVPVAGCAALGALLGGPLGLVVGAKAGAAALLAGSALGYVGARLLGHKRQEQLALQVPVAGCAALGALLGGPLGLVVGAKAGAAALLAGSALGYVGARLLGHKRQEQLALQVPVAGCAALGALLGGPLGLVVGAKAGAAALLAGSALGYVGARLLGHKRQEQLALQVPVAGCAALGALLGGPLGLVVGAKAGAAALLAGSALGYVGARLLGHKRQEQLALQDRPANEEPPQEEMKTQ